MYWFLHKSSCGDEGFIEAAVGIWVLFSGILVGTSVGVEKLQARLMIKTKKTMIDK
jgi:hypothetical protein